MYLLYMIFGEVQLLPLDAGVVLELFVATEHRRSNSAALRSTVAWRIVGG